MSSSRTLQAPVICHIHISQTWKKWACRSRKHVTSYVDHTWTGGILKNKRVSSLEVLAAVQEEGLKVNRQKVQLVQQEVKYLGAVLGIEGQTPDKQSVELIQKLPSPTAPLSYI